MRYHIHLHRTADAQPGSLASLYADLARRMLGALADLKAKTRDAAWREDLHPRAANGQFGEGGHPVDADMEGSNKPTSTTAKGGMDKVRELFASGHGFTKAELLAATGLKEKALADYLAMLKNPKWAGKKGALTIERRGDEFFVAQADGKPAPPLPPSSPPAAPPAAAPAPAPAPAPPPAPSFFDANFTKKHEALTQEMSGLVLRAHKLTEDTGNAWIGAQGAGYHAGERAKSHLRSAQRSMDESRRTMGVSEDYRLHMQGDAQQALKAAHGEIIYGEGQVELAKARVAEEEAKKAALPGRKAFSKAAFVPQKNIKAAAAYAEAHGFADRADFAGLPVEVANAQLASLHEHLSEFPALRHHQNFAGSMGGYKKAYAEEHRKKAKQGYLDRGLSEADAERWTKDLKVRMKVPTSAWACSWGGRAADFGSAVAVSATTMGTAKWKPTKTVGIDGVVRDESTAAAALRRGVESKFHPKGGDTIKSVLDHEYGHQLDNLLGRPSKNSDAFRAIMLEAGTSSPGSWSMPANTEKPGSALHAIKARNDREHNITNNLSKYASTNAAEFLAEAWSEFKNNPNPRPIAQKVGEFIKAEYARKYPNKEADGILTKFH